jgi:phospholipid transport system substrate-binding protein
MSVRTTLNRPGAPPARVDWIVSSASGSPKIIDLLAEGTSLRLTQRSDYSSFLVNHGNSVQELIAALRRQVEAAQ